MIRCLAVASSPVLTSVVDTTQSHHLMLLLILAWMHRMMLMMMTVVLMVLVSCEGGVVHNLLPSMLRVPLDRMLDDPLVGLVVLGLRLLI